MKYNLRFNWFEVIFYSFFVTYGYFGLMTKIGPEKNLSLFLLTTVVLVFIQTLFGFLSQRGFTFAKEDVRIHKKDFFVLLGIFGLLCVTTYEQLKWDLFDDALSYAGAAHLHSVQGLLVFGSRLNSFSDSAFQYLAQFLSFLLLLSLIFIIWITHRLSWIFKTGVLVILLILSRFFIFVMGGNGSPHPSFELIMPFVFGSLLGLNSLAFKLSYLFSSAFILFLIYRKLKSRLPALVLALTIFSVATIPLFLHISTSVEHSLFSGLVFMYVFAELIFNPKTPYFRLISVISVATMMRQPCFIALVPVVLHYLISEFKRMSFKSHLKNLSLFSLPVLFFMPFLAKSLIYGTPATQAVDSAGVLSQLKLALTTPIVFIAAANSVNLWWLAFIPFAFFTWQAEFKKASLSLRFFTMAAFVVFYSIHPSLWGHAKYQFEFIVPLCVTGFLIFVTSVNTLKYGAKVLVISLIALIGVNLESYLNYQRGNRPVDELISLTGELNKFYNAGYKGLVTSPFNYSDAFADLKALKFSGSTYVLGGSYGVMQEILNGYTLSQAVKAFQIYKDQQGQILKTQEDHSFVFDAQRAHQDLRINAILIGPVPFETKKMAISQLQDLGWRLHKSYMNTEYGSSLALMLRSSEDK